MSVAHAPGLAVDASCLQRLSSDECTSWVASHDEGRLGYVGGRGPRRVVTRYVLSGDWITLRVPDYNDIAHYVPGELVSLVVEGPTAAVDGYESVQVSGRARLVDPDATSARDERHLDHWPPDVATKLIRVPLSSMSGVVEKRGPALGAVAARQ